MRIHSDLINHRMIYRAAMMDGVYPEVSVVGSRSHARAFEVKMTGNSFYPPNSGNRGASQSGDKAATWDEWGVLIGRLYLTDPEAVWGTVKSPIYADSEHFHWVTGNRFVGIGDGPTGEIHLPHDTHKRHKWEPQGRCVTGTYFVSACKTCSAIQRWMANGYTFADISGAAWLQSPVKLHRESWQTAMKGTGLR